ncbi:hypothetical protein [Paludisphaera sp.]|uniref:hypothetical protein n=1 Tax=Paludisphaera sp. TaxID=2017432 RepID=UPI00301DF7F9
MTARTTPVVALFLAASLAAGCGDAAPAATDVSAAKEYLTRALDAWKAGEPRDSLASGSPTILVKDPDWDRKSTLSHYALEGEGQPLGAGVQWTVPLTLLSAKGKNVKKQAVYVVNIADDVVAVSRQDMDF